MSSINTPVNVGGDWPALDDTFHLLPPPPKKQDDNPFVYYLFLRGTEMGAWFRGRME